MAGGLALRSERCARCGAPAPLEDRESGCAWCAALFGTTELAREVDTQRRVVACGEDDAVAIAATELTARIAESRRGTTIALGVALLALAVAVPIGALHLGAATTEALQGLVFLVLGLLTVGGLWWAGRRSARRERWVQGRRLAEGLCQGCGAEVTARLGEVARCGYCASSSAPATWAVLRGVARRLEDVLRWQRVGRAAWRRRWRMQHARAARFAVWMLAIAGGLLALSAFVSALRVL